ncbi:NAD(P)/FAD-dependent oxidoreductase [Spongiibacter sp. KMU-158]|uniref:NAD(P)/FAD-dependent oxidoreductase n=1 Tax=Spongiibacter pelagi TaxID=2760804 RepID=A0A927GW75_9GAMM|nr:FAD-dependent oxidoreductase [Spongiibacter pelagi]MBD2858139.1 NAD(P)/FAD-dependent oxidoreductase [Spongiibacter pelagi]
MNRPFSENAINADARPIVIVGTGPVGIRVAELLVAKGCTRPIKLFGDEPWEPYDRIRLSSLLAGELKFSELSRPPQFNAEQVSSFSNCAIVEVNCVQRFVIDQQGTKHFYSDLILAVGSEPFRPSIPGLDAQRVYTFRDLNDTQALLARSVGARRVLVAGGGLLGLETARAMQRGASEVTVVQQADRLMNRQLDVEAAALLQASIEGQGISVKLGAGVREILTEDQGSERRRVCGVRLYSGETIACDTVILSAGIRPRTELAIKSGIAVARGIVVDENLQTSRPHVFAIGECAEINQQIYGLVGPGYEQASVLAARLCGEDVSYHGSINTTELKVVNLPVFSIGELEDVKRRSWRLNSLVYKNAESGVYRKLILRQGKPTAAVAIGEWTEVKRLQESVVSGRRLGIINILRFMKTGSLWPSGEVANVNAWPASALVCNCRGLSRGELSRAYAACENKAELIATTGASTVCGSCTPLIAELCGENAKKAPMQWGLLVSAAIAFFLSLFILSSTPIPYADSVQHWLGSVDKLWSQGLYKQISGFSLLGLSILGLYLSINKRIQKLSWGSFRHWRLVHSVLGGLCLFVLFAHTGLRMGENLNAYLMSNFLALALLGGITAAVISGETAFGARLGKRLRRWCSWGHIALFWPLPTLLGFHVISVYYF